MGKGSLAVLRRSAADEGLAETVAPKAAVAPATEAEACKNERRERLVAVMRIQMLLESMN